MVRVVVGGQWSVMAGSPTKKTQKMNTTAPLPGAPIHSLAGPLTFSWNASHFSPVSFLDSVLLIGGAVGGADESGSGSVLGLALDFFPFVLLAAVPPPPPPAASRSRQAAGSP